MALVEAISLTLNHAAPIIISAVFCGMGCYLFLCVIVFDSQSE